MPVLASWELGHGAMWNSGAAVKALESLGNSLRGFRAAGWGRALSNDDWAELLAHPSLPKQLLEVDVSESCPDMSAEVVQRLCALPHLRRLGLGLQPSKKLSSALPAPSSCANSRTGGSLGSSPMPETPFFSYLSPLSTSSTLTHVLLNCFRVPSWPHSDAFASLARCTQLKRLTLTCTRFLPGDFARLFTAPTLARTLEYLNLSSLHHRDDDGQLIEIRGISRPLPPSVAAEYTAAFSALRRLDTLHLQDFSSESMLLCLAAAATASSSSSSLRHLRIHNARFDPRPTVLETLLASLPLLRVHFSCAPEWLPPVKHTGLAITFSVWRAALQQLPRVSCDPFDLAAPREPPQSQWRQPHHAASGAECDSHSAEDKLRKLSKSGQFIDMF
jgi:hypothetical protein